MLVVAKNDFTHQALAQQLQSRRLRREYLALVRGRVTPRTAGLKRPLGATRCTASAWRWSVAGSGHPLQGPAYLDRFTLLQLSLRPGAPTR